MTSVALGVSARGCGFKERVALGWVACSSAAGTSPPHAPLSRPTAPPAMALRTHSGCCLLRGAVGPCERPRAGRVRRGPGPAWRAPHVGLTHVGLTHAAGDHAGGHQGPARDRAGSAGAVPGRGWVACVRACTACGRVGARCRSVALCSTVHVGIAAAAATQLGGAVPPCVHAEEQERVLDADPAVVPVPEFVAQQPVGGAGLLPALVYRLAVLPCPWPGVPVCA